MIFSGAGSAMMKALEVGNFMYCFKKFADILYILWHSLTKIIKFDYDLKFNK